MAPAPIVKNRAFFISLALVVLLEYAAGQVSAHDMREKLLLLSVARAFQTLAVLLTAVFLGGGLGSLGLMRGNIGRGIFRGFLWGTGFGLLVLLGCGVLYLKGVNLLTLVSAGAPGQGAWDRVTYILVGSVVAGISEEVFFRGLLLGYLRRLGAPLAVLISAALFVLPHWEGHRFPATQAVGGLLFGTAFAVEKNLMVPIVLHVFGNLALFLLPTIVRLF